MTIKTVLFDLDGTLLPMDLDHFVKVYFKALATHLAPHGYDPKWLVDGIWAGMHGMLRNDGAQTNEQIFWKLFAASYGTDPVEDMPLFETFYRERFDDLSAVCGHTEAAKQVVDYLESKGKRLVLATNPVFPRMAVESRLRWAGVAAEDFSYITSYENASYSKPNPDYYREILARCGLSAEECLMVGNDVTDDMVAETLGMKVFLLTDWLINKPEVDIDRYPHGSWAELMKYLEENCG